MKSRPALLILAIPSVIAFAFGAACTDSTVAPVVSDMAGDHPILFSSNRSSRGGQFDIYKVQADGTDSVNLTNSAANDVDASWSPDGKSIAFSSNRAGAYHIFVMNDDGSDVRQLTADSANDTQPRWSPDGQKIVFASSRNGQSVSVFGPTTTDLFVMQADGSKLVNLTSSPLSSDMEAAWSPDGKKILFGRRDFSGSGQATNTGGWFTMNGDGTGLTPFTVSTANLRVPGSPQLGAAAWSPDATRIAIVAQEYNDDYTGFPRDAIVIANVDGSNAFAVLPLSRSRLYNYPAFSPDGKQLLFTMIEDADTWGHAGGGDEFDIGTVNVDGSGFTNLTPEHDSNLSTSDSETGGPEAWRK